MTRRRPPRPSALLHAQGGFTLVEVLIVSTITLVVASAIFSALEHSTRIQTRDQAFAQQITDSETSLARLIHDLRQVTQFQSITPNTIQFQMVASDGKLVNVAYTCTATDSLGAGYTRCAQAQQPAPTLPAPPGPKAQALDIVHLTNGSVSTFCNAAGTAPSGSVFFPVNVNIPNQDGSGLACDESYEQQLGSLAGGATYLKVLVKMPASGGTSNPGYSHQTVLQSAVFLPNVDVGA